MTDTTALDEAYSLLRESAETVLNRVGIKVKPSEQNSSWLKLSSCPWCGHDKNYQCAVHETAGDRGYLHAVKCMHPHDSPTGDASPHYADFLVAARLLDRTQAEIIKASKVSKASRVARAATATTIRPPADVRKSSDIGLINEENNAKSRRRLAANSAAMEWLKGVRGYTQDTIDRFKLGLSEPYQKDGATIHAFALAAPLIGYDGRFYKKYVNYAIPGVTQDNREKPSKSWSPGEARAYYNASAQEKPWIFICDGLKDLWALDQLIRGSDLADTLAIASSTNGGGGLPSEWRNPEFWDDFGFVFAGHDNDAPNPLTGRKAGDEQAKAFAAAACRDVRRVTPPGVKDWNDWILQGHTLDEFRALLDQSTVISLGGPIEDDDGESEGRFAANPVSIVGEYHNGYMYEAVRTLVRERHNSTGEMFESYSTIVIRSDRTQHRAKRMPAPVETHEHNTVWRLVPDGTLLSRSPEPNPNLTWEWASISTWLNGKERRVPLKELLISVQNHLRGSVWLPYEADFTLLACAVVASYVQEIFDAVPLLLVTGAAGSGKSELGEAMRGIGANSRTVLGRVSAATLARHIDATRGLVIIDDLEQIGVSSKDAQFDDLVQTLKLSYKKTTAMKMVTEFKNGHAIQREFNFFGIKVINNTRGSDDILGSRMLKIATRHMPAHIRIDKSLRLTPEATKELRNNLHTWAFNNVKDVANTYQAIFPNKTGRGEEIAAPLRVIAALSGDITLSETLEKSLARQTDAAKDPFSPEEVLREALESIIRRSIEKDGVVPTWVTVTQVIYEAALLVDDNYGKEFTTSLSPIAKPEWVGRSLIQAYIDNDAPRQRTTMYGKTLRAYKLTEEFIGKAMTRIHNESPDLIEKDVPRSTDFRAFCKACKDCAYANTCDMQKLRVGKEGGPK